MKHQRCVFITLVILLLIRESSGLAGQPHLLTETPAHPNLPDTILVKGDWYYPPYEFLNERGEPDGFNVEIFQAIARELGLNYRLELGPWHQVRDELIGGDIHVILGLMVSPWRSEMMDFGIPHSVMTQGIFARKGAGIRSLEDLAGKEVVVQESDLMHEFLLESGLTDRIVAVPGQLEALTLLNEGMFDAALIGNFQGSHLIREHQLKNISLQTSNIDPRNYGMAVRKGDSELLALLNAGLFQLKASGEYDKLYEKWFAVYEQRHAWTQLRPYVFGFVGFVGLLSLFILLLRMETRRIKKRLHEVETRYSNVFQNNHAAMMLIDPETATVVDVNPAAVKFYGWPPEAFRGKPISEINTLSEGEIRAEIARAVKEEKKQFTLRHRLADGQTRWVDLYSGMVRFGGKNLLYSIIHDITDRKLAEASNRELEAFAYTISHDLRAPLRAIDGFSQILLEDHAGKLGEEGQRVCRVISENTRRMSQLINDLLAYSRITRTENLQKMEVHMDRMADSVYHELANEETRKRVHLEIEALPRVQADPSMIRQVWSNLIGNALKFTSKVEHPRIRISAGKENRRIIFAVTDNGIGFDMQHAGKMFEVFQRLHSPKDFEGSGVGLAIVKRIVEQHEGTVWAEGAPGMGAVFFFSLPGD